MIRVFTGRDSREKREQIYNLIKGNSTVITPEQSTLIIEKEIMDSKSLDGLIDIRVTSFKRMITKLTDDIFSVSKERITDVGKQMLFRYILKDKSNEFRLFSSVYDKEGFIEEIIYTIETLESEGIDPEVLYDISVESEDHDVRDKLHDIYIIYSEYLHRVKDKYFHIEEGIKLFNTHGATFNVYSRESVWILGFKAFDKKALSMIESLTRNVGDVNIVLSYEDDDIFAVSKHTLDMLNSKFDIEEVMLTTSDTYFSKLAKMMLHDEAVEIGNNVTLFKTSDMYSEVEYVALDIIDKLNHDKSLRLDDFRVIIGTQSYNKIVESTFSRMNLPIFTDSRRHIINSKVVKTIISLMNIMIQQK